MLPALHQIIEQPGRRIGVGGTRPAVPLRGAASMYPYAPYYPYVYYPYPTYAYYPPPVYYRPWFAPVVYYP